MNKECLFCYSKNVINNQCIDCNARHFMFYEESLKNIEYKSFLMYVNKKTKLEINLINFLYRKKLLKRLMDIRKEEDIIGNTIVSVPAYIELKNNYEKNIEYIYSTFNLYNKDYSYCIKDNTYNLTNKNKIFKIDLDFFNYRNELFVKIEYLEKYTIPHDIKLLNKKEKKDLKSRLTIQIYDNIVKDLYIDNQPEWIQLIELNLDNDLIDIQKELNDKIDNFYNYVLLTMNKLRDKNSIFFERAILELEIKSF